MIYITIRVMGCDDSFVMILRSLLLLATAFKALRKHYKNAIFWIIIIILIISIRTTLSIPPKQAQTRSPQ
jgi:hypothetical protein